MTLVKSSIVSRGPCRAAWPYENSGFSSASCSSLTLGVTAAVDDVRVLSWRRGALGAHTLIAWCLKVLCVGNGAGRSVHVRSRPRRAVSLLNVLSVMPDRPEGPQDRCKRQGLRDPV